jgi:hypothetical protein
MSRWLLVEVADDLAACLTTRTGVWLSIRHVSGVRSLTDLAYVTAETVQAITRPPEAVPTKKPKPRRARKQAAAA